MLKQGILALVATTILAGSAFAGPRQPVSSARPGNFKDQPVSSARPVGFRAPTTAELKKAIWSDMGSYKNVPSTQLNSKKFAAFIKDPKNYRRISLMPKGIQDASAVAFLAKNVYPGKVFVEKGSFGRSMWVKGYAPKF